MSADPLVAVTQALTLVTGEVARLTRRDRELTYQLDAIRVALATALADLPEIREKVLERLDGDVQAFFPPDVRPLDSHWRAGLETAARGMAQGIRRRAAAGVPNEDPQAP